MGIQVILKNVRCSFPQLFKLKGEDGEEYGPGIVLLLDPEKDKAQIVEVKKAIKGEIDGNASLKKQPPTGDKLCLRAGNREEYPEGSLMVRANSKARPVVLDRALRKILNEAESPIYSGCRVNAKVEIWGQADPKYGRRVNAKVIAVQFAGDDETFDSSHVSEEGAIAGFEALDDLEKDLKSLANDSNLGDEENFLDL